VVVVVVVVVNGLCFKLHFCTCRVVRTSAEPTPYKSATSPIPFEPIIVLTQFTLHTHSSSFAVSAQTL